MLCSAHEQSSSRKLGAPHALDGWCVGPAMESHRCQECTMRGTRIIDTVTRSPHKFALPLATTTDLLNASVQDLAQTLQHHKDKESLPTLSETRRPAANCTVIAGTAGDVRRRRRHRAANSLKSCSVRDLFAGSLRLESRSRDLAVKVIMFINGCIASTAPAN